MLSKQKINEVKELLSLKTISQRTIAKITGVSRIVIHRIATGKRKERPERKIQEWEVDFTGKPYSKCQICGAKVIEPCLACIIKKVSKEDSIPVFPNPPHFSLKLQLEDKHHVRYEQIKKWREGQDDPNFIELPDDWPFRRQNIVQIRKNIRNANKIKLQYER